MSDPFLVEGPLCFQEDLFDMGNQYAMQVVVSDEDGTIISNAVRMYGGNEVEVRATVFYTGPDGKPLYQFAGYDDEGRPEYVLAVKKPGLTRPMTQKEILARRRLAINNLRDWLKDRIRVSHRLIATLDPEGKV